MFHHCRELQYVTYGIVQQHRYGDKPEPSCAHATERDIIGCECDWCRWYDEKDFWEQSYDWLAERVGYYPLFLAVGTSDAAQRMTGYQLQWRKILAQGKDKTIYRTKPCNRVLFSFDREPHKQLQYQDYDDWHFVLSDWGRERPYIERKVLKRSWSRPQWHRYTAAGSVQACVPELDLRNADLIRVRNKDTQRQLVKMGFDPERIRVERWKINDEW